MSIIEDAYKEIRQAEEVKIAKKISEKLTGGKMAIDPVLVEIIAKSAGRAQGITVPGDETAQIAQDPLLTNLGFSFDKLAPQQPTIEVIRIRIEELRHSIGQLVKSTSMMLSREKLEEILKNEVPNQQARLAIIDLFLEKSFITNNLLSRMDAEELAQGRSEDPEALEARLKDIILPMGETIEEVNANKVRRGIKSKYSTPQPMSELKIKTTEPKTAEPLTDWEYGENRVYYTNQYLKSSFCFCLAKLAAMPATILWLQNPATFKLEIPSEIHTQLSSLSGIAEQYGLFDYPQYLEQALATYMRIFLGYYKNEKQGKLTVVSS